MRSWPCARPAQRQRRERLRLMRRTLRRCTSSLVLGTWPQTACVSCAAKVCRPACARPGLAQSSRTNHWSSPNSYKAVAICPAARSKPRVCWWRGRIVNPSLAPARHTRIRESPWPGDRPRTPAPGPRWRAWWSRVHCRSFREQAVSGLSDLGISGSSSFEPVW